LKMPGDIIVTREFSGDIMGDIVDKGDRRGAFSRVGI
jgi:hypothetical protein